MDRVGLYSKGIAMTDLEERGTPDHDDWDRHWADLNDVAELNPAQHYRHQLLQRLVRRELNARPQARTVMDFGCGQGDLIQLLAPVVGDRRLVGFELSRVGVQIAATKTPHASFHRVDLVANMPEHPELFSQGDLCICSEVIEHLDEPQAFLHHARRYIAPGGTLVVTVPSGPMNAFEKSIGHRQHFTSESIASLVASAGMRVLKVERAGFPFFNLYKIVGFLRGDRLRADAETKSSGEGPALGMKIALMAFDVLFKFNLENTSFGWQLIIVSQNPP
jgi:2-polyprenyl-3-methyl-5-hydroxy-6-metoxy-1,4-benzoquinol methylase